MAYDIFCWLEQYWGNQRLCRLVPISVIRVPKSSIQEWTIFSPLGRLSCGVPTWTLILCLSMLWVSEPHLPWQVSNWEILFWLYCCHWCVVCFYFLANLCLCVVYNCVGFVKTQKQPSLPTSPWMPFPVLISVLSKFLPPPTVALIRKHHEDHKVSTLALYSSWATNTNTTQFFFLALFLGLIYSHHFVELLVSRRRRSQEMNWYNDWGKLQEIGCWLQLSSHSEPRYYFCDEIGVPHFIIFKCKIWDFLSIECLILVAFRFEE